MLWHKLQHTWELAKDGGVIVTQPRRFMVEVVGVEALSYVARMGVNATFMYAYDIPGLGAERVPDRGRLVDLLDGGAGAGCGGRADGARKRGAGRRRAAECDLGL